MSAEEFYIHEQPRLVVYLTKDCDVVIESDSILWGWEVTVDHGEIRVALTQIDELVRALRQVQRKAKGK